MIGSINHLLINPLTSKTDRAILFCHDSDIKIRRDHGKSSYESRVYESVGDRSLLASLAQKLKEKIRLNASYKARNFLQSQSFYPSFRFCKDFLYNKCAQDMVPSSLRLIFATRNIGLYIYVAQVNLIILLIRVYYSLSQKTSIKMMAPHHFRLILIII